jgi:hypothetical protein
VGNRRINWYPFFGPQFSPLIEIFSLGHPQANDYQKKSSIRSDFDHIRHIDILPKNSYSDIDFQTLVSTSTNNIILTFWSEKWQNTAGRS